MMRSTWKRTACTRLNSPSLLARLGVELVAGPGINDATDGCVSEVDLMARHRLEREDPSAEIQT